MASATRPSPGAPPSRAAAHPPAPRSGAWGNEPAEPPTFAFLVASLGGWLIVVEGMLLLGGGAAAFEFVVPLPPGDSAQLGSLGVTLGLVIVGVGFFLHETVGHRKSAGLVTLVLGALSVVSGGGFLIGLGLTVVGGLIAALGRPTPLYHPGHYAHQHHRSDRERNPP